MILPIMYKIPSDIGQTRRLSYGRVFLRIAPPEQQVLWPTPHMKFTVGYAFARLLKDRTMIVSPSQTRKATTMYSKFSG
jgi:hypothetical protein